MLTFKIFSCNISTFKMVVLYILMINYTIHLQQNKVIIIYFSFWAFEGFLHFYTLYFVNKNSTLI